MIKLVGVDRIYSKKKLTHYIILHTLNDALRDSKGNNDTYSKGQSVEPIMFEDGTAEIQGELIPGCEIRVLKEKNDKGFDEVSLVICKNSKK